MATYPSVEFEAGTIERLSHLLEFWTQTQAAWLLEHPEVPHPYDAGIRYQREPQGRERWQRIGSTIDIGYGDCEDLAVYLAAWYRARRGINAKVGLKRFEKNGKVWYHAVVVLPDGSIEDPSKKLGM